MEYLDRTTLEDTEFCVLDVETTGMSPSYARIIEIGIVRIKNLVITESYSTFINPGCEVPFFITNLTGISNSDVREAPFFDEVANKIKEFIGQSVVVGHNLQFDMAFIRKAFSECYLDVSGNQTLCTLKLSRKLFPQLSSKSLSSVTKYLGISHKNVHRALGDATVTAKALIKIIKQLREERNFQTLADLLGFEIAPSSTGTVYTLIKKKLADDYAKLPELPGVYYFKDSKDEVIYVGKAKSLKRRVRDHFSSSAPQKSKKIVKYASRLGFEVTNSELTALIAEAELIKIHNPKYNLQLKKYRQSFFIKILNELDFPYPEYSYKFEFDDNDYFGPYSNRETVQTMLQLVERAFALRECNDKTLKKGRICYLADIGRCLAPCTAETDGKDIQQEYQFELQKVYEFLSGKSQVAVDRLIWKMKSLSEKQKFEEAAHTRDLINLVLAQIHKSSIIAEPINKADVLIEVTEANRKDYIIMLSGKVFIKDYIVQGNYLFDTALDDYFDGAISILSEVENKDLEKMKIILNWLSRNRNSVRIFYLKDFCSKKELLNVCSGSRNYSKKRREVP